MFGLGIRGAAVFALPQRMSTCSKSALDVRARTGRAFMYIGRRTGNFS
jgi:hypothetical protein